MTAPTERSRLEQTGRRIVAGTWGCAGIVMAGSATNAVLAYGALGDNRLLGLATGLGVDIGLCVALIGDRQLHLHGLSSHWGRALRVTTLAMSLVLNVSIALRDGHYLSALMHAFLPLLLLILTEYGADVLLKFTALAREQEAAAQAAVAPIPVTAPLPQLHRPLAPPPVTTAPLPTVRPIPNQHREQDQTWAPARTGITPPASATTGTSSAASAAPCSDRTLAQPGNDDALVARVRKLLANSKGRAPGRRTVAKRFGVTEHEARVALDRVAATAGPVLNGTGGRSKSTASGGGAR